MQWIKEHRPLAESSDFGKSLMGVQNLQKKHQALLNEITSYEGNIQFMDQSAKELVSCDHFASSSIEDLNADLQHGWKQLKLLAAGRTQKLSDALEAQKVSIKKKEGIIALLIHIGLYRDKAELSLPPTINYVYCVSTLLIDHKLTLYSSTKMLLKLMCG